MSTTAEELLSRQSQLMNSVFRALSNFKKLGQAKMTLAVTKHRLESLKDIFHQCQELDGRIHFLADDDLKATHAYFQGAQFTLCEDSYNEAADFMAERLHGMDATERTTQLDVSRLSDSIRPSSHLPKINLPNFDGSLEKWESFRDRFTSMIHNDSNLTNVERMHYLFSCLKGDASNALTHLAITENNFPIAWKILVSRYENKRRLITIHLHTLCNLPSLNSETAKDLRDLRDKTNMAIQALKNLGCSVEYWDDIIVFLVAQKLDKSSRKAWELKLGDTAEFPTYGELDQFLDSRIRALDAITPVDSKDTVKATKNKVIASHSVSTANLSCPLCKANHLLHQCSTFVSKTPSQRFEFIKKNKRCVNCFSIKHAVKECTNPYLCKQCQKKHHTLLHFDATVKPSVTEVGQASASADNNGDTEITSHVMSKSVSPKSKILLATARVRVYSQQGRFVIVRALLDQGSVSTLISGALAQSLRLSKIKRAVQITGIGETQAAVRHAAQIIITPAECESPAYTTTALILKSLTNYTPNRINADSQWKHITELDLADREFMNNDPIDIIIGADLFGMLLLNGVRKGSDDEPVAQNTTLGWILSGPASFNSRDPAANLHIHIGTVLENLDSNLRRFWEIEEIPQHSQLSAEEKQCEEHFLATHFRNEEGRYVLRLPFKSFPPQLGESRFAALSSLRRMEQRFEQNPALASEYRDFLSEYERLGHMVKIAPTEHIRDPSNIYYIPHHAVLRAGSSTTRLRVVFNASCRTTNGTSLNDHLLVGRKLQVNLPDVILQWRQDPYVYTADIEKMYRQILINPKDTDFLRILWRLSRDEPIAEYRLVTVTYGTASAPHDAIRTLDQLAIDEGKNFPLAVLVIRRKTYVDDCVFGADDPILARQTRDQLIEMLKRGGFRLRKWASNSPELLSDIDPADHGMACDKNLEDDETIKVLGIAWNPKNDNFKFKTQSSRNPGHTKREILSTIAKLYDPLGWVTPVIVAAKIFMQKLWQRKCKWDDPIPQEYLNNWLQYYAQLKCLENISIPRWTTYGSATIHTELHGFSDASAKAYAAVVYLRVTQVDGSTTVSLLTAKSKVAPLKTISIPRLELQAAHLLARLILFVESALQLKVERYCWTDSSIVLAWLNKHPSNWQIFVANRVSAIQTILPDAKWRHVPTKDNPADCASRGSAPDDLVKSSLWWAGPQWLKRPSNYWPDSRPPLQSDAPLEERTQKLVGTADISEPWDLASRFSSWPKLLRVTAYMMVFIDKLRRSPISPVSSNANSRQSAILPPNKLREAKLFWLKTIQAELFAEERSMLARQRSVPKSSALSTLNPYLDSEGLIRLKGRLRHSSLPEATKNPIILRSHPLLSLIITHHHIKTLHAGPQLTLASLRNEFWILRARAVVRAVLFKCIACTRERAEVPVELMGDLPDVRINRTSRAFVHTGVDYAGPFLIRSAPGRGYKAHKAYIALFICLTTRAIHLELVSDYTSATFIASYHRFVSRRGQPTSIYSDNGTTFQGADREMTKAYFDAIRDPNFLSNVATDGTSWHFLPPAAPHFGGLWEAGVRSVKHHLKRCIGANTLTFEEMTTFLCRVEACLNSRPIAAMSDSIEDYQPLTPGHFLIGAPLMAPPEPSVLDLNENRLSRWQLIQRFTEGFWKVWANDYLHTLQQRPKWRIVQRLAKRGQIVLVRNPLAPPSQWELGRITECHPGDDGLVRVVTVKTKRSEYKRPIAKLCFLPVDINVENSKDSVTAGGAP